MVLPIMRSFSGREFAAEFVEEIEDETYLVHRSGLSCARGLQYCKPLTVGVQVKVIREQPEFGELAGRPELGLVGVEGVAGRRVGDYHDLAVQRAIKKFLAVARPLGK